MKCTYNSDMPTTSINRVSLSYIFLTFQTFALPVTIIAASLTDIVPVRDFLLPLLTIS